MSAIPQSALALGLAGLIPFYASAGLVLSASLQPVAQAAAPLAAGPTPTIAAFVAFAIYSAVILSFLGGVRWGLALQTTPPRAQALLFSVAPSIAGWAVAAGALAFGLHAATLPPIGAAFGLLFLVQYLWDRQAPRDGAPAWYPRLRLILTIGVLFACLMVAASQALTRA
jgi:hypothetical protein